MENSEKQTVTTLQERVDEQKAQQERRYGAFKGVFTPTLLTILGVIMYLRTGVVVGNAGLLGAWLIVGLTCLITVCTALSLSSIVTNIRIGAGGAYSIISQSLGLEMGGSLGIPLYLSQALAVSMYIFGFREGWVSLFPAHPAWAVDGITFLVLFVVAFISANLAFRIQYVIMAIILASLVSIFGTVFTQELSHTPQWWGSYPGFPEDNFAGTDFWFLFALFFPAATGIMAGANMSGELSDPRRAIPLGTLTAVGLTALVYFGLCYWLSCIAAPEDLVSNYTIVLDRALYRPIVVAGLLGATLSSGLASLVGAPRILLALGQHRILPASGWFSRKTSRGEPRNATLLTGGIVFATLLLRDLNAIAPLITMFFLITYGMINIVVLMEQSLGLISFRPTLRVPTWVPLVGAVGCGFAMFVVHPIISLVAVAIVVGVYAILVRRHLRAPFGDMRSGLFVALADWAAKRVSDLPSSQERAWKPNLLVPVHDIPELQGAFEFIGNLAYGRGSVKLLGLGSGEQTEELKKQLPEAARALRKKGVFATWTRIEEQSYAEGLLAGMQALRGAFFQPNVLFLDVVPGDGKETRELSRILDGAVRFGLGILLFLEHPRARLGQRERINVWIREKGPDWNLSMQLGNVDMALLTGHLLNKNWDGELTLCTVVPEPEQKADAETYLRDLIEAGRLPGAGVHVDSGTFDEAIARGPGADLNIFGLPDEEEYAFMQRLSGICKTSCLFVRDSGQENILA